MRTFAGIPQLVTLTLLVALLPQLSAGDAPAPGKVDVTPAFDYIDMVKDIRGLSAVYRIEADSVNPTEPTKRWAYKRILTLSLGDSAWRIDDRPDYSGWKNVNTPPLEKSEMNVPYIANEVLRDISVSQTSSLFTLLDRRERTMVVYSYSLDKRGDIAFKEAQFDEMTIGHRFLHSVLLPLRYVPSESLAEYGNRAGLWSFRNKAFVESTKKRLYQTFIERVDGQGDEVWFNFRTEVNEDSPGKGSPRWVLFRRFAQLKGRFLPVRYEDRNANTGKPYSWTSIEWKIASPDLALPLKLESGGTDGGLRAAIVLQESKIGVKIQDGDATIDPNEAQSVEDFVTGLPIETGN